MQRIDIGSDRSCFIGLNRGSSLTSSLPNDTRQPNSANRVAYYRDPFEEATMRALGQQMRYKSFALGARSGNSRRRTLAISALVLVIIMVLAHRFGFHTAPQETKASALNDLPAIAVPNAGSEIDLRVPEPSPAAMMDSTEGLEQQDTEKNHLD